MGRPIGNIFVVSGPKKPGIQNEIENPKNNRKNLVGYIFEDVIFFTIIFTFINHTMLYSTNFYKYFF